VNTLRKGDDDDDYNNNNNNHENAASWHILVCRRVHFIAGDYPIMSRNVSFYAIHVASVCPSVVSEKQNTATVRETNKALF
jgi:hypothetical protein